MGATKKVPAFFNLAVACCLPDLQVLPSPVLLLFLVLAFFLLLLPRMRPAGSHRQVLAPPRGGAEGRGGHHARDHTQAGGFQRRREPPWRPAQALPRTGPHAPISEEPLGGTGWRSTTSVRRCSVADAGREEWGRGPPLKSIFPCWLSW